ncbi:hypothetical protein CKO25_09365 [Thiocapsa imhoffii]|uniref:AAA domain-containing protein n=1 Tax=Thiocapsa imhoffii TaxID=382777 RepID=A0A9X1B929_9GAMM|nr:CpsD/CapB family tyrosine-protein kinase [Thiocapsa imhoffii]MBK1644853.1 hypothetical protein [Thiocapsa imhoffii]
MDRLSKALEKARADRALVVQQPTQRQALGRQGPHVQSGHIEIPKIQIRETTLEFLEAHRVLTDRSNHQATTAYKLLRTQVVQQMKAKGWKTLVVTSPNQGNGKTVTAINLAINIARQAHQDVLLIDLDLRHPSIHRYLCEQESPGLSDYIAHSTDLSEILFTPGIEGLTVLPGREAFPHSSETLLLNKTITLIDDLQQAFSAGLIILDMPPVLSVDDVVAFSSHWDAVLLVVEEGITTETEVRKCLDLLKSKPLLGTVMNKSYETVPENYY